MNHRQISVDIIWCMMPLCEKWWHSTAKKTMQQNNNYCHQSHCQAHYIFTIGTLISVPYQYLHMIPSTNLFWHFCNHSIDTELKPWRMLHGMRIHHYILLVNWCLNFRKQRHECDADSDHKYNIHLGYSTHPQPYTQF